MFDRMGAGALDYAPYKLEGGRVLLRGPKPLLGGAYCAFLGGSETYGRFVPAPYPALVERSLGLPCANFGCIGGGVDVVLHEEPLLAACAAARVTVVALTGAQALSNRMFKVHPRRNDRFIRAAPQLRQLYPDVDFAEFHFTRHMLTRLHARAPAHFAAIVDEMQTAWLARMRMLIARIAGRVVLLWLGEGAAQPALAPPFGREPLFISGQLVDELRPLVADVVICRPDPVPEEDRTQGMVLAEVERPAAREMLPVTAHRIAAEALIGPLRRLAP